jgi:hypothetical protein
LRQNCAELRSPARHRVEHSVLRRFLLREVAAHLGHRLPELGDVGGEDLLVVPVKTEEAASDENCAANCAAPNCAPQDCAPPNCAGGARPGEERVALAGEQGLELVDPAGAPAEGALDGVGAEQRRHARDQHALEAARQRGRALAQPLHVRRAELALQRARDVEELRAARRRVAADERPARREGERAEHRRHLLHRARARRPAVERRRRERRALRRRRRRHEHPELLRQPGRVVRARRRQRPLGPLQLVVAREREVVPPLGAAVQLAPHAAVEALDAALLEGAAGVGGGHIWVC